jgi:hypothetical protein
LKKHHSQKSLSRGSAKRLYRYKGPQKGCDHFDGCRILQSLHER